MAFGAVSSIEDLPSWSQEYGTACRFISYCTVVGKKIFSGFGTLTTLPVAFSIRDDVIKGQESRYRYPVSGIFCPSRRRWWRWSSAAQSKKGHFTFCVTLTHRCEHSKIESSVFDAIRMLLVDCRYSSINTLYS